MRYSKDQLILRDGQAAAGKVLEAEFINTSSLATQRIVSPPYLFLTNKF